MGHARGLLSRSVSPELGAEESSLEIRFRFCIPLQIASGKFMNQSVASLVFQRDAELG